MGPDKPCTPCHKISSHTLSLVLTARRLTTATARRSAVSNVLTNDAPFGILVSTESSAESAAHPQPSPRSRCQPAAAEYASQRHKVTSRRDAPDTPWY